jgi:hypothetical protein
MKRFRRLETDVAKVGTISPSSGSDGHFCDAGDSDVSRNKAS